MNRHLSLRSGNPALSTSTFKQFSSTASETMTIMGAVHKTALSLLLLMTTALYTWNLPFGLLVTLIWLYLELLRLLSKLYSRR